MLNGHDEQQFGIVIRDTFIVNSPIPNELTSLPTRESSLYTLYDVAVVFDVIVVVVVV